MTIYELNDARGDEIFNDYFWSKEMALRVADDIRYHLTNDERKNRKIYIVAYDVDIDADIDADEFVQLIWDDEIECHQFDWNRASFSAEAQVGCFELDLVSGEWTF